MSAIQIRKELHQYIDKVDERFLSAVHKMVQEYLLLDTQLSKRLNKLELCQIRLNTIKQLPENWDGYGASTIDKKVIKNCLNLLNSLPDEYIEQLDIEDIVPSPYGTITIEWENKTEQVVSLEIGENKASFFAELPDGSQPSQNELFLRKKQVPKQVIASLKKLYEEAAYDKAA